MCFGGSNASQNQANYQYQQQQAADAKRKRDIQTGQHNIDAAFQQFNPAYFNQYMKDYGDYYLPQLDYQRNQAQDQTVGFLADRGMLESSVGASKLAELQKAYGDTKVQIGNQAKDAANALRRTIEQTKTGLYNQNLAAADPAMASARATGEASAIAAPQSYTPLGQVFSGLLNSFNTANNAAAASMYGARPVGSFLASGSGSGTVR